MNEIINFFDEVKIFYIATVEDGKPKVRPFGELLMLDNKLYFNTGNKKRIFQQLKKNPYVELCSFQKGTWYRVEGKAVLATTDENKMKMFEAQPIVKKFYEGKEEKLEIFRLDDVKAYKCNFNGGTLIYEE